LSVLAKKNSFHVTVLHTRNSANVLFHATDQQRETLLRTRTESCSNFQYFLKAYYSQN